MGFETLKNIIEANQVTKDEPQTECPDCAWPLNVNSTGEKSCPICEKVWK